MSLPAHDWANDNRAQVQRDTKVHVLWRFCFAVGISSHDLEAATRLQRRHISLKAEVSPSNPTSSTWPTVLAQLTQAEAWAAANPDVAAARRTLTHLRAELLDLPAEPRIPAPRTACLVPPIPPESWPKGWPALVALGPFEPQRPCGITDCGAPGVIVTPVNVGPDIVRCTDHPPIGDQWGARLNWTPKGCKQPLRCYCGRCPGIPLQVLPTDAEDRTTLALFFPEPETTDDA